MSESKVVDAAVLMLVGGVTANRYEQVLIGQGHAADAASSIVAEARARINLAAKINRDEQLGLAMERLNHLYKASLTPRGPTGKEKIDLRTALRAQQELNRLLRLIDHADVSGPDPASTQSNEELESIAAYLLPLGLVDDTLPLTEHARVAAQLLRDHGLADAQPLQPQA